MIQPIDQKKVYEEFRILANESGKVVSYKPGDYVQMSREVIREIQDSSICGWIEELKKYPAEIRENYLSMYFSKLLSRTAEVREEAIRQDDLTLKILILNSACGLLDSYDRVLAALRTSSN